MDQIDVLLNLAADAAYRASKACECWENGGDPAPVADTAWEAEEAISLALEAVAGTYPTFSILDYPETRLGRLVLAARLLLRAGTDESGRSEDLSMAARLLKLAGLA
ncbi:hypothetical protein SOQ14_00400 [Erythrobacter sp. T5W1-R]|uniref:hypothetical protein n=1 Tax=Erythrobacter sp. T5W1-R TaxID=3101752 RepID=UPI002AFE5372|nr:hypothetical protein [Erythrobacter sp. T5W1-R]MEA1617372.1 hypothetical protein [Erythrobacter sp. T5W1-R]